MERDFSDWWERWWKKDYSWEGLAALDSFGYPKHPWPSWRRLPDGSVVEATASTKGRPATLQDYWRDQEHDLIESPVSGKKFTRIHIPLEWEDGTPTGKSDWVENSNDFKAYQSCVNAKLNAPDEAQFQGAVLLDFDVWSILDGVEFLEKGARVYINVAFDNALFYGKACFDDVAFLKEARFEKVLFLQVAMFRNSTFSFHARFDDTTFCGEVFFDKSLFRDIAWFQNSLFLGNTWFTDAIFLRSAFFTNSVFCGPTGFVNTVFSEDTWFDSAVFAMDAWFSGDGAVLRSPEINQEITLVECDQESASGFAGRVTTPSQLTSPARQSFKAINATNAAFLDDAWFDNRDILKPSSFRNVLFYRRPIFHGSKLHHGVSFHNAKFENSLTPENAPKNEVQLLNAIPEAALKKLCEAQQYFKNRHQTEAEWRSEFLLRLQRKAIEFSTLPQSKVDDKAHKEENKDQYFADLEDAFRTLKLIMEERRNRQQEGRFFRLELQARRKRRDDAVPLWERLFSDIYRLTSDYGNSAVRPLGLLVVLIAVFAGGYALLGSLPAHWPAGEDLWQALSFSTSCVLPFGPWTDEPAAETMMGRLLHIEGRGHGAGTAFAIRLIATLQSLMAIVLVFLAGLAIRRRFQIN